MPRGGAVARRFSHKLSGVGHDQYQERDKPPQVTLSDLPRGDPRCLGAAAEAIPNAVLPEPHLRPDDARRMDQVESPPRRTAPQFFPVELVAATVDTEIRSDREKEFSVPSVISAAKNP
jgi:hypothetical protein